MAHVVRHSLCKRLTSSSSWIFEQTLNKSIRSGMWKQNFEHFFVLDFEATCLKDEQIDPQEIIEFPCLKVSVSENFNVTSEFHKYVRPIHHPELSVFCVQLTGIIQDVVDISDTFPNVFQQFMEWLKNETADGKPFTFVTCGDWDLKIMMPKQCKISDIEVPNELKSWINLKKSYSKAKRNHPRHLTEMVEGVGLKFEGRLHSGIDDTRNIAKVLKKLAESGFMFSNTQKHK